MRRLIECVPNFSEGRDRAIVDAIAAAMGEIPGAFLLGRESDPDHNRSVITLAGEPEAVAEAALRGVGKAAELIDLTRQTGGHPRVGAADVVPFVPIEGVAMEECVTLAKNVGREIWRRYRVPVYFYEAAAERPERANLENIRRGQFEGLREQVLRDPERSPDVGGPRLHPTAGATVVGTRKFLIAYNINLNTPDLEIAKRIAKAIRFSSGGLPYVKAMGVDLESRHLAQVSMNLTDFEQTPLHRVFEMVKSEAQRCGVTIAGSQIVGLVPKRAIELTASHYLQLENFSPAQVLENRMEGMPRAVDRQQELHRDAELLLDVARRTTEVFEKLGQLEADANPSILADIHAARREAAAAAQGALESVDIHWQSIADPDFAAMLKSESQRLKTLIMEPIRKQRTGAGKSAR
jgi:glutamate formiminotransferase